MLNLPLHHSQLVKVQSKIHAHYLNKKLTDFVFLA